MARGRDVEDEDNHMEEVEEVEEVPQNGEQADSEAEGDEEEFEIEAIIEAKHGVFGGGQIGYLVKWKGFDEKHNSWVSQEDAVNAQDLIKEYWNRQKSNRASGPRKSTAKTPSAPSAKKRKPSTPVSDSEEDPAPKRRGRPPKAAPKSVSEDEVEEVKEAPSTRKMPKKSISKKAKATSPVPMDEDEEDKYVDMKKYKDAPSWQHLVDHIDTVERRDDGKLYVYFRLKSQKDGTMCREESALCKKKMPQMLLDFYERNLRWKPMELQEQEQA